MYKPQLNLHTPLLIAMLVFSGYYIGNAQTGRTIRLIIPEISILDIEPSGSNDISLNFTIPTEAGEGITTSPNNSNWLNYTSCVALGGTSRTISVQSDRVLPGIDLKLQASNAFGGGGTLGSSNGQQTISTTQTTIITGIGGSYTGDGVGNGHQLTFQLEVSDYSLVKEVTNDIITITYTISN